MIAKGLPLAVATLAAVVVLAGGIFGKAGCGYLAERIGVRRAFAAVQALTALGLVALVAAPGWLGLLLLAPLGVVAQGSTSITYGLVPDMIAAGRVARGYALMYGATSFASALGPFLFGLVADRHGIGAAVALMAGLVLVSVPPVYLLPARPAPA
jgi:MFS family permease